jgi:hypothetical protein
MMVSASTQIPYAALRRLARKQPQGERCELCSALVPAQHSHLIEVAGSRLLCCCDPCAILFSGQQSPKYRRVPRRVQFWPNFQMTDGQWEELHIPINLTFFFRSTPAKRVMAIYPSPAGGMESLLTLEMWRDLVAANPALDRMEPDVEALLVNRIGASREYYLAPIDECYKLVGLIRSNWRGLAGGAEVWEEIQRFFTLLKAKSETAGESAYA